MWNQVHVDERRPTRTRLDKASGAAGAFHQARNTGDSAGGWFDVAVLVESELNVTSADLPQVPLVEQ